MINYLKIHNIPSDKFAEKLSFKMIQSKEFKLLINLIE